jgi:DNA gyrase subunit A
VLLASWRGQLKRLAVSSLRLCQRGDLGQIGTRLSHRDDRLLDLQEDHCSILGMVLEDGRNLRYSTKASPLETDTGSEGQGILNPNERLAGLTPLLS